MTDLLRDSLQRARFEGWEFPILSTEQDGARAVTEHEAWRRDGAELVQGGRRAYRGRMTAALVNTIPGYGELYPARLDALVDAFATRGEGELAHPLLGTFRVVVPTWKPRVEAKVRNGAFLDFEWIEQRASVVGVVATSPDRGDGDPRVEVASAADEADSALATAGIAPSPTLAAVVAPELVKVSAADVPYADLSRSLDVIGRAGHAALATVNSLEYSATTAARVHTARAALARLQAATARLRAALLPDPSTTRIYVVPRAMTLAEVSRAVYGTPTRAADLRAANGLASVHVRAGRVLQVLP